MWFAILEYAGAVGVLVSFWLSQTGTWRTADHRFLGANALSGAALTAAGVADSQWGFVVLNAAWTGIAAYGLARLHRGGRRPGSADQSGGA